MKTRPAVSACSGTWRATQADQITDTGPIKTPQREIRAVVADTEVPKANKPNPAAESSSGSRSCAPRRFLATIAPPNEVPTKLATPKANRIADKAFAPTEVVCSRKGLM